MYLIHPLDTSATWMNPSFPSYSSRVPNAPKFFTLWTVQTTSSPSSGHSYSPRFPAFTPRPPGPRPAPRPSRPSASRGSPRTPGTGRRSRGGRRQSARCRSPRISRGGTSRSAGGSSLVDLHELELLRPPGGPLVGLLALLAPVPEMDPLRGLLAALRLRPREPAVPAAHPPEPPLAPPHLRPRPVLHTLDLELRVLVAVGAVAHDYTRHFHRSRPGGVSKGEPLLKHYRPRGRTGPPRAQASTDPRVAGPRGHARGRALLCQPPAR